MARSSFSIRLDPYQLVASVEDNIKRQMPYIIATALNTTAKQAQTALQSAMRQDFDRPTPYTMNALRVTFASKARPVATVGFKDESFKGTPATKYLLPEVDGGDRNVKRIEQLLRNAGILPATQFVVPGDASILDQYGNFNRGQYSKILAQLQASRDRSQNETGVSRKRKRSRNPTKDVRYFVGQPGGGKEPDGVWARYQFAHGSAVRPVLMFVNSPHYTARFPFDTVVQSAVDSNLSTNVAAAFALAYATSR